VIKAGDYVRLNGIESRPGWNGMVVQAIEPDPNNNARWMVTSPDSAPGGAGHSKKVSIAILKMEHLRPLK